MQLSESNALVTGGSGSIGNAVVEELARAGANVTVGYQHDKSGAQRTVDTARSYDVDAKAVAADITDDEDVENLIERASASRPVTVLVNCAGMTSLQSIHDLQREELRQSLAVNIEGTVAVTREVLNDLRGAGRVESAAVVNVSSVAAELGTIDTSYAASKAGLLGATRALARELGSENIRVNAVAPGPVDTPMNDQMIEFLETQRFRGHETVDTILDRYEAQPSEIASAVRFLAEHEFITGEVLHVDGGMSL